MIIIAAFCLMAILPQARATFLENLRSRVSNAKSQDELKKVVSEAEEYERAQLACEFEIIQSLPPAHCYEGIKAKRESGALNEKSYAMKVRQLDYLCRKHTKTTHSVGLLKGKLNIVNVSKSCLLEMETKLTELEYLQEESSIDLL